MEKNYNFTQDVIKSQVTNIAELLRSNDNSMEHQSKLLKARKVLVDLLIVKAESSSCLFNCINQLVVKAA
jgi:hypothetical protein